MYEVVDPNDMWMRQFEASLCLMLELIQQRAILDHQVGKEFQRDIALQLFIVRQPDNPHSASAKNFDQSVTAKDFLSADKLSRGRCCDTARRLVSHFGSLFTIMTETKVKARLERPARIYEKKHSAGKLTWPLALTRYSATPVRSPTGQRGAVGLRMRQPRSMEAAKLYFIIFGVLTIAGGIVGYVKAGSMASIMAGSVTGVLLLVAAFLLPEHRAIGLASALILSLLLAAQFVPKFLRTGRVIPAGVMSVLSVIGIVAAIVAWVKK